MRASTLRGETVTRVRHTSLAVLITAAVMAVVTAGTAFALPSTCPPRHALNLHHVNWGDVAIPGALCRVKGVIRLHKGQAKLGHSGYGPLEVSTSGPAYGDLGGGQQVAALQVWCSNQGGTAAGPAGPGHRRVQRRRRHAAPARHAHPAVLPAFRDAHSLPRDRQHRRRAHRHHRILVRLHRRGLLPLRARQHHLALDRPFLHSRPHHEGLTSWNR